MTEKIIGRSHCCGETKRKNKSLSYFLVSCKIEKVQYSNYAKKIEKMLKNTQGASVPATKASTTKLTGFLSTLV